MEGYKITGKSIPKGNVYISGSKNAALPIIAASILNNKKTVLKNIPHLTDVENMCNILSQLNFNTEHIDNKLVIEYKEPINDIQIDDDLATKLRASILLLGPLLTKYKKVKIFSPGGCKIGLRPIDLHIKGLRLMGANIAMSNGYIYASVENKLQGKEIYLDFPSVGATENIMMAAVLAQGKTTIVNASQEPEVIDLANFLVSLGSKIKGIGSNTIIITGVKSLSKQIEYTIIPDRIEAGTFAILGSLIPESQITLNNININHMKPLFLKLTEMGIKIKCNKNSASIVTTDKLNSVDIKTLPYPGFPTDLQPQMAVLLTQADGTGILSENIFDNRFSYVGELNKMGADIHLDRSVITIRGKKKLTGTTLNCFDLRSGASMVLASLIANGNSIIFDTFHIERGYENFINKLLNLGVRIEKIKSD